MTTITGSPRSRWMILAALSLALFGAQGSFAQAPAVTAEQKAQLDEALRLSQQARTLFTQRDTRNAAPPARRALEIRQTILGENHADTATSHWILGVILRDSADFGAARTHLEQSLQVRRRLLGEEHAQTALAWYELGYLSYAQGEYAAALPPLEQALKIRVKVFGDDHEQTAESIGMLGVVHFQRGDYAAAREQMERSLQIQKKKLGAEHANVATALNNLGFLLDTQGDYAAAADYYEQALKIYRKTLGNDHPRSFTTLNNLGNLRTSQGDYAAARVYLEETLKIRTKVLGAEHADTATSLQSLGLLSKYERDYVAAAQYFERALKIRKQVLGDSHPDTAVILHELGALHSSDGEYATARPYIEEALERTLKTHGEDHYWTAAALANLAHFHMSQGDRAAARPYFERALASYRKSLGEIHPRVAWTRRELALIDAAEGNPLAARTVMDEARRGANRHIARVLPGLGDKEQLLFLKRGDEQDFHAALSLAFAERTDPAGARVSAAWVLNGKGVAQEALAQRSLLIRDTKNPDAAAPIQKLIDLRRRLATLAVENPNPGNDQKRRDDIARLTAEETALVREVARKTARPDLTADSWVELDAVRKAIPADAILIEIVRFNELNIRFTNDGNRLLPARYAAWLIPPANQGDVSIVDLGSAAEIDWRVTEAVNAISQAGKPGGELATRGEVEAEKSVRAKLTRVSDLVWKPLAAAIPAGVRKLILSPDGDLWMLPWSALPVSDDRVLIEDYIVQYEISGRELARPQATYDQPTVPLIFADPDYDLPPDAARQSIQAIFPKLDLRDSAPGSVSQTALGKVPRLPNTALEAEAAAASLRQIAAAEPKKYLGQWALETVVKRANRPRILLLSTHGYFLPDQVVRYSAAPAIAAAGDRSAALLTTDGKPVENPLLRCGLLFAGCNHRRPIGGDEGILTGLEVVSLDLRGTELVVLSACETAAGQVRNGQGVAGLRQAFQLAGAQSVVATLWSVPDRESMLLMNDFFERLAAGQSRPEALRGAQLARIAQRKTREGSAHPFFWAAWTVTGERRM